MKFITIVAGLASVAVAGVLPGPLKTNVNTTLATQDYVERALRITDHIGDEPLPRKWKDYSSSLINVMQLSTDIISDKLVQKTCNLGERTVPGSLSLAELAYACREIDMSCVEGWTKQPTFLDVHKAVKNAKDRGKHSDFECLLAGTNLFSMGQLVDMYDEIQAKEGASQ